MNEFTHEILEQVLVPSKQFENYFWQCFKILSSGECKFSNFLYGAFEFRPTAWKWVESKDTIALYYFSYMPGDEPHIIASRISRILNQANEYREILNIEENHPETDSFLPDNLSGLKLWHKMNARLNGWRFEPAWAPESMRIDDDEPMISLEFDGKPTEIIRTPI